MHRISDTCRLPLPGALPRTSGTDMLKGVGGKGMDAMIDSKLVAPHHEVDNAFPNATNPADGRKPVDRFTRPIGSCNFQAIQAVILQDGPLDH